jgi:enoyl-CoA hydratase/carnithine racemase
VTIDYVRAGPVATFTLRNGKVNPLTGGMLHQMHETLVDFLADPELKVGILTGAGERAFSAGDDIKSEDPVTGDRVADLGTHLYRMQRLALGESDAQDTFLYKR